MLLFEIELITYKDIPCCNLNISLSWRSQNLRTPNALQHYVRRASGDSGHHRQVFMDTDRMLAVSRADCRFGTSGWTIS